MMDSVQVLPPPPAGVYAKYPEQEVVLSGQELHYLRESMPPMPPSWLQSCRVGRRCSCTCATVHTVEDVLNIVGAVHGQALLAKMRLSCDDYYHLGPQLSGIWDALFICNDAKQCFWELRAMKRADEQWDEAKAAVGCCCH
jgi:hypothetical protein